MQFLTRQYSQTTQIRTRRGESQLEASTTAKVPPSSDSSQGRLLGHVPLLAHLLRPPQRRDSSPSPISRTGWNSATWAGFGTEQRRLTLTRTHHGLQRDPDSPGIRTISERCWAWACVSSTIVKVKVAPEIVLSVGGDPRSKDRPSVRR